ncbi:MAG: hypothetical protein ACMXX9_02020 [Candidatus Woesearchaeota archaeon]
MFVVKCPKCGNNQKTDPRIGKLSDVSKKVKKCVYCGHSFKIHPNIDKTRIVSRD